MTDTTDIDIDGAQTPERQWKKRTVMPQHEFVRMKEVLENDTWEGVYEGLFDRKNQWGTVMHHPLVRTESGTVWRFPSHRSLVEALKDLEPGTPVRIIYRGTAQNRRGKTYHVWDVYYR
jgi:hypothetical protein